MRTHSQYDGLQTRSGSWTVSLGDLGQSFSTLTQHSEISRLEFKSSLLIVGYVVDWGKGYVAQ